jgi:hypothetical protein
MSVGRSDDMPEKDKEDEAPDGIVEVELLQGGDVAPLQEYQVAEKHHADTARYLAYGLVGILGLAILAQYVLTMVLIYSGKSDAVQTLDKTSSGLFPMLSGLVGSATTYYFTREKR